MLLRPTVPGVPLSQPTVPVLPPTLKLTVKVPEILTKGATPAPRQRTDEITTGATVGGYISIRNTDLEPVIPQLGQPLVGPEITVPANVPKVNIPTFQTRITPIKTPVRRPADVKAETTLRPLPVKGSTDNIISVLNKIDPAKLVPGRPKQGQGAYQLPELKEFARKLGIKANQNKPELIDAIQKIRQNMGMT